MSIKQDLLYTNKIFLFIPYETTFNKTCKCFEFDPHVWHILLWRLGHEKISTAILPLLLIQEEQLSVTGERMCTKYW